MTSAGDTPAELILLPSLRATRGPRGGLVLTRKYMSGAMAYARHWPGPVTSLVRLSQAATTDMDHQEYLPGDVQARLEVRPSTAEALSRRIAGAAAVVALLSREEAETARLCERLGVPVIFVSEYSPRTERQILAAEAPNLLVHLRRLLWLSRTERIRRACLPHAAGLQCSGTPTHDIYRDLCRDTMLFFDNRVQGKDVISDPALDAKLARLRQGHPLRLVFGGRLIAMKGVLELPRVAAELARAGVSFTFDIFGSGPLLGALEERIRAAGLQDRMQLRGVLDFDSGWVPWLRDNADLFICCHPQGDPSSTYPEVMSCGVPIAGYDNEAFRGVVRESGSGWLAPARDAAALARVVARLDTDRGAIAEATRRARDFARMHAFEPTFARRSAHIIRNSRLPDALRTEAMARLAATGHAT